MSWVIPEKYIVINKGLELVWLQETAKKVPDQLLVCGTGGPLKILNGKKLILDFIYNQFGIIFRKPVTGQ
jgi:hypothetical protein